MSINIRIAQKLDLEEILAFEKKMVESSHLPEAEKIFLEWSAPWRRESLEHYLPLGWSFVAHDENQNLLGYFLGQALIFFESQTQSLWIEYFNFINEETGKELTQLAVKLGREKHLQRVYFPFSKEQSTDKIVGQFTKVEPWKPDRFFIKTTRTAQ